LPPESPTLPGATSHVTLRLGDDVGAPSVRVTIRGDAVEARIIASDPAMARDLAAGTRELASALTAQGFTDARVAVRGRASALDTPGLVNVAGSTSADTRGSGTQQGSGERSSPEQRTPQRFDDRPHREHGRPRHWL